MRIILDRDELIAAKIGPAFGTRAAMRIRHCAGNRSWWRECEGPFRTERAARRWARKIRRRNGATLGIYHLPPNKGNKCRRWFVAILIPDSPRGLAAGTRRKSRASR